MGRVVRETGTTTSRSKARRVRDVAQFVECLPSIDENQVRFPKLHEPGVLVHICNPDTREMEPGGSEIQGHPKPSIDFGALSLKKKKRLKKNLWVL